MFSRLTAVFFLFILPATKLSILEFLSVQMLSRWYPLKLSTFCNQSGIVVHHHELEHFAKRLVCYGQGHKPHIIKIQDRTALLLSVHGQGHNKGVMHLQLNWIWCDIFLWSRSHWRLKTLRVCQVCFDWSLCHQMKWFDGLLLIPFIENTNNQTENKVAIC